LIKSDKYTPEAEAETLLKHIEAGVGYVVLPASCHVPQEMLEDLKKRAEPFNYAKKIDPQKFMRMETKGFGLGGMYYFVASTYPPESRADNFKRRVEKIISIVRSKRPEGVPIIANCMGMGVFPESFVSTAKAHEDAGVDLIEVNIGCGLSAGMGSAPDYYLKKNTPLVLAGVLAGDQPDLVESIVSKVVKAVRIPVGVKLTPETGFPRIIEVARAAKKAGARFINCSNNAVAIPPPDIYNGGRGKWPFMEDNFFCASSGNWMRTIVYKQVASIAKFVPGIDVICTGGIVVPENIVEAMMLGAKTIQFATGLMFDGRASIKKNVQFLSKYMQEQGYRSPGDFTGLGLKYIKSINEVNFEHGKIFAEVDPAKCTGCKRCVNHVCLAMEMDNDVAKVDIDKCIGCGMCVALCTEGAPSLHEAST
jgi:dihydropyrimidine dehydrogenase (NAD+) subunit PreA